MLHSVALTKYIQRKSTCTNMIDEHSAS